MIGTVLAALLLQSSAAPVLTPHQTALDLFRKHDYEAAAAAFRQTLAGEKPNTPDYQESTLLLGQCLFLTNHTADAIATLEKAQHTTEALYMLGNAYLSARDAKKAAGTFAEMYHLDPDSAAAHLITAQMMIRKDFGDEAIAELHRALELNPHIPQAHYLLGELEMTRGAPDAAIADLQTEITLNPDSAMAYYKLGDAYTRRSDWTTAVGLLEKSIWLNPDYSGPYIVLGKCYLKLDQLGNAEGVLRHAVAVDTRNYSAHYLLGQTLMGEGKTEEGRQMLELSQKLKQ